MNQNDPNAGIRPETLERYEEASLCRCTANLADALAALCDEHGVSWADLAVAVYPIGDEIEMRQILLSGMLSIKGLNKLAQRFGLEPHILFRPRTTRATTKGVG